jgi:hypothetical protein
MSRALRLLGEHWYPPLFGVMVAAVWLLARTPAFMQPGGESALLADLCLTAPALYVLCYGRRQPLRATLIRALAIACAGVWLASWLIPAAEQRLLPQLAPLRWAGLAVVILFEIRLVVAATRIAFSGKATPRQVMEASDAPEWVARLMLLEARFWRGLWRVLRGRGKGRQ